MNFSSIYTLKKASRHIGFPLRFPLGAAIAAGLLALMLVSPVSAEGEDLSDNETCLECHADTERSAPADSDRPQVHNADGSFAVEDHEMWSCNDCHTYITEIPHADDVAGQQVDCLECHEEVPAK